MNDQDQRSAVRFGTFELDLRSLELRNDAARVDLQRQPLDILQLLLERPGALVTRTEICQRLWPDGTFVDFDHSLNAAIRRLRRALSDDAHEPRFVETVPRRGYRFIGAVRPSWGNGEAGSPDRGTSNGVRVAVLPFSSPIDDRDLSQGLTDEVIGGLCRRSNGRVAVISRMSSIAIGRDVHRARDVGELLQVSFLLEGGVRRYESRLRISVWLVDTQSETPVWSTTHVCEDVSDPLTLQLEVSARIVDAVLTILVPGIDSTACSRVGISG